MRLLSLFTSFFLATVAPIFGAQHTFILQDVDSNQFLIQEGDTSTDLSPYCTFNIALSLIGFDTNILQDTKNPLRPFQDEYEDEYRTWNDSYPEKWKVPHHPTSWMLNSCVWYSQEVAQQLGMSTLADYLTAFNYGKQNLSGDRDKANGLTHAWLGSSLRISPLEQVRFINQLVKQELPVSARAHELTKAILFVEVLPNGMVLYGKTGSGSHAKGQETDLRVGWFVGWVEKGNREFTFVYMVQGTEPGAYLTSFAAKEQLKQRLLELSL